MKSHDELFDELIGLLNRKFEGDYYKRFWQIALVRGKSTIVEGSHFWKLDSVSMQLLIEALGK